MKSNEFEACKSGNMLTSFFVRFSANITMQEFEDLKRIAIRSESVLKEHEQTHILIGRHWVAIVTKAIVDSVTGSIRVVLPCDPSRDSVCVKEDDDSDWIYGLEDCINIDSIDLDEEEYSTSSNEAWIRFRCRKEVYRALFNIVIDPQHADELDETILKLVAKYFDARDLPAMFRPM